jgi:tripartite ATP-independent transporter DctM subunit
VFEPTQMVLLIVGLLALVLAGVHVAVALGAMAVLGMVLMHPHPAVIADFVALSAFEVIREYVLAVIPLFMLMGELLARSGAARDVFALAARAIRRLPGRLALTTVLANAIFAFVTGVSIAAAASFARIAWPVMRAAGYRPEFGLGCIAGSACLGMLIPPSVLMIVWAVVTETSVGDLYLAGIVPGLIVTALFAGYVVVAARLSPDLVGEGPRPKPLGAAVGPPWLEDATEPEVPPRPGFSFILVLIVMLALLLAIWRGVCTATEGAGVGVLVALLVAKARGLTPEDVLDAIFAVGRTCAPLLLLLVFAQIYTRALSMTGMTGAFKALFLESGLEPWQVLALMVAIWFALGCIIDSIPIIVLTLPVFHPVAVDMGFDPVAFAILGILAIETGLLTPPFGILVYTVKAAQPDEAVTTGDIFRGVLPYWVCLLVTVLLVAIFPGLATWLPSAGK